jgi:endonuclease/exonuclease/phosphatase family metal-dependent hydrolase
LLRLHRFDIITVYAVRVPALCVMSLNVRQPDGDDGSNNWDYRKDLLLETILDCRPDAIGTQELFVLQAEFLTAGAPQYGWFGTGRFGDDRDKHVGVFYRKDTLRLLANGDFWLSETPEIAGSSSWEIIRPRQVTWGLFETAWGARFEMFNTHFPYRKVEHEARWKTAELILGRIAAVDPALPVILTADFNSAAGGEIHEFLTRCLRDAWLEAPRRIGPEGTLNGFGKVSGDRRIDWILFRAPWHVRHMETVARSRGGVYPSDHYPVVAEFEM